MNNDKWLEEINKEIEIERRNYKGPHCCLIMDRGLLSDVKILNYDQKLREYAINISNSTRYMIIDYCMFCGKKMPNSLRHEWHDILEEEYKLEHPAEKDRKKVPKEFWTDEWWKKRNL